MRWRILLTAIAAMVVVTGCGSTRQFYDGPKRSCDEIGIIRANLESGVRIVRVDLNRVKQPEDAGPDPASFKGKIALLPGQHTIEVLYHTSFYNMTTEGADRTTLTYLTAETPKILTFDVEAGRRYRIEAESRPADWPPGALEWNTWVVEETSGTIMASTLEE